MGYRPRVTATLQHRGREAKKDVVWSSIDMLFCKAPLCMNLGVRDSSSTAEKTYQTNELFNPMHSLLAVSRRTVDLEASLQPSLLIPINGPEILDYVAKTPESSDEAPAEKFLKIAPQSKS